MARVLLKIFDEHGRMFRVWVGKDSVSRVIEEYAVMGLKAVKSK